MAHKGYPKVKADKFWTRHGGKAPFPSHVDEFLDRVAAGEIRETDEIQLRKNGRYYDVLDHRAGSEVGADAELDEAANDNERLKTAMGQDWDGDFIPF